MCLGLFTLGCGKCDYNVSMFRTADGKFLGRHWVRGTPPSKPGTLTRESINQILPRDDGAFRMSMNLSHLGVGEFGGYRYETVKVSGWSVDWRQNDYAASTSFNFYSWWTMAAMSDNRTASWISNDVAGQITVLDADGNVNWVYMPTGPEFLNHGVFSDGTDVFASVSTLADLEPTTICLDGTNGAELWRAKLLTISGPIPSEPIGAVDGDVFGVNGSNGNILRFDSSGARVGTGVVGRSPADPKNSKRTGEFVYGLQTLPAVVHVGDLDLASVVEIPLDSVLAGIGFVTGPPVSAWVAAEGVYVLTTAGIVLQFNLAGDFQWWNRCSTIDGAVFANDITVVDDRVYVVHDVMLGQYAPPPFPV